MGCAVGVLFVSGLTIPCDVQSFSFCPRFQWRNMRRIPKDKHCFVSFNNTSNCPNIIYLKNTCLTYKLKTNAFTGCFLEVLISTHEKFTRKPRDTSCLRMGHITCNTCNVKEVLLCPLAVRSHCFVPLLKVLNV